MKTTSAEHGQNMGRTWAEHVLPMFCACSFHGNSMNNLLSYCGLIHAKIRASDKDLPVCNLNFSCNGRVTVLNFLPILL